MFTMSVDVAIPTVVMISVGLWLELDFCTANTGDRSDTRS